MNYVGIGTKVHIHAPYPLALALNIVILEHGREYRTRVRYSNMQTTQAGPVGKCITCGGDHAAGLSNPACHYYGVVGVLLITIDNVVPFLSFWNLCNMHQSQSNSLHCRSRTTGIEYDMIQHKA